jgi:hypothetical protein
MCVQAMSHCTENCTEDQGTEMPLLLCDNGGHVAKSSSLVYRFLII